MRQVNSRQTFQQKMMCISSFSIIQQELQDDSIFHLFYQNDFNKFIKSMDYFLVGKDRKAKLNLN